MPESRGRGQQRVSLLWRQLADRGGELVRSGLPVSTQVLRSRIGQGHQDHTLVTRVGAPFSQP